MTKPKMLQRGTIVRCGGVPVRLTETVTAEFIDVPASEVQPAAATQEREALREMTSALKGFVEWHGGAHVGPCPEDDTCDCPGKPYNDAVNEVIRKADAILKVQPAAAAPQDETLALVNQALTKAGSRHIVGTKDGVIVACTIEEALQPAAAAPPIDLESISAASMRAFQAEHANDEPVHPHAIVRFSQLDMDAATKPLHAELERLRADNRELRTLAKIGTWHNDCRPNRHQAARELEKSQAVIDKLADTITQLEARLRALQGTEQG